MLYIHSMISKTFRRQRIKELLAHNQVLNQEQLQQLLGRSGLQATQATLSRDLHDLGVYKGPMGYRLPDAAVLPTNGTHELERLLPAQLLSIDVGGNLIVLKTLPGHANPLAIEIDKAHLDGALGTIAGDDTVFVAAKASAAARRIVRQLHRMAGWDGMR